MAKHKRSFFERLTGTVNIDDEFEQDILAGAPHEHRGYEGEEAAPDGEAHAIEHPSLETREEDEADGQLAIDVHQTPEAIVIKAIVAGVKPGDLDVSITRDMVTIRGSREESSEVKHDDYFFRELYWGSFSRTVVLPEEVDVDAAEANEKHGLLTITLPKIDTSRRTKLKIKAG